MRLHTNLDSVTIINEVVIVFYMVYACMLYNMIKLNCHPLVFPSLILHVSVSILHLTSVPIFHPASVPINHPPIFPSFIHQCSHPSSLQSSDSSSTMQCSHPTSRQCFDFPSHACSILIHDQSCFVILHSANVPIYNYHPPLFHPSSVCVTILHPCTSVPIIHPASVSIYHPPVSYRSSTTVPIIIHPASIPIHHPPV